MKRILIVLFLVASLLTIGCNTPSAGRMEQNLTYFQDSRTKQCFAYVALFTGGDNMQVSVTYVPCTPEILEAIKKDTGKSPVVTANTNNNAK